ncbi:uncharacterized protein OCT59_002853 [Rhizophagus irregularis]|uniref:Replication origin-binding protein domain-containing protein n=1 Tax=Rhizophagus irregularis (strain DAOM 181602 / DAOM 197198 / MUCL 43194) TaxID=747089 RepID=A0A2H5T1U9_RHIID|nr:hypothetical protein GLOIN_2v1488959 [Rhizophagus irregularis DAOM 181602=DAOM 197198]POG57975.1 hypothetical protein GLOIN_2v1488959 [Rhizophagus irregularis DAOM 181602=DAOM 197198]UZO11282.1 hypothetical protein OCT59_002853 [Rhizophagus irregularis]GBC36553.1 putative replication origin-binding protein [Rhizophagus irregularis DAOM 181602=DAOM 197198]|eukprot:XP_025164841.1 hypothetical protein GLOIN_2v1488959 [Rhizophagus irregularis DAOM 181602=DAOM 197198]
MDCQETLIDHAISLANDLHVTYGFSLRDVTFPFANFDRSFPTHCTICNETHHRDNSLYLFLKQKSETLWAVEEGCRQDSKRNHRTLGYLTAGNNTISRSYEYPIDAISPVSASDGQSLSQGPSSGRFSRQDLLGTRINCVHGGTIDPGLSVDTSADSLLTNINKYSSDSMADYELVPTLLVRGNMGLGKTKTLRRYLDKHFPRNASREPVIRFVTFRQTFSQSLQPLFPDFTSYKDIGLSGICQADFPRVIVQVESLHRIIIPSEHEPIDLLILDEVESTLAQFSSGLHKHFSSAFAAFKWMLSSARHVVCMDANLGARTVNTLRRMRALPTLLHWNVFSRAKEDQFFFTTNMGDWIESLLKAVHSGQKIVVPANCLKDAKFVEELLHTRAGDKKVELYSSETLPSKKKEHFGDVHSYWSGLDVFIYTPTVSAGTSFELEHFDTVFACFSDNSCDVETCRQMLARVRKLRTREYFVCFRLMNDCHSLAETTDEISQLLHDKRTGLYQTVTDVALQFEHTVDGGIRFYKSDYFHLWLETERLKNLSKNKFMLRFVDQVASTGASIALLPAHDPSVSSGHRATYKSIKNELELVHCEAVATSPNISKISALSLVERLNNEEDVTVPEKNSLKKYNLRELYEYGGEITPEFIKNYSKPAVKQVYHNLENITCGKTVDEALQKMREHKFTRYTDILGDHGEESSDPTSYVKEGRDLLNERKTYAYHAHCLAIGLLRRCGFQCIRDMNGVQDELLERNIRELLPALKKHMDKFLYEFEVRKVNVDALSRERDRGDSSRGALCS